MWRREKDSTHLRRKQLVIGGKNDDNLLEKKKIDHDENESGLTAVDCLSGDKLTHKCNFYSA